MAMIPACGSPMKGSGGLVSGTSAAPENRPPAVSITTPSSGASFPTGQGIFIQVQASAFDGAIAEVGFYQGSKQLAISHQAPFFFTWNNVLPGTYSLTAIATDTGGLSTRSSPITVLVTGPAGGSLLHQSPTVSILVPQSGAVFTVPANISLTADTSSPDGTIVQVQFFEAGNLIGTATGAPFAAAWANPPPGVYSVSAVATDDSGASTTSSPVTITVDQPPSVAITKPSSGATFATLSPIEIDAQASDPGGTVTQVEFFQGTALLGTSTAAPFTFTWSGVSPGSFSLTAVATDAAGITTRSQAVSILVSGSGGGGSVHQPPSISLNSPPAGASFSAPATILLAAKTSAAVGTIARVDFLQGGTAIGTATTPPYSFIWSNVPPGSYSLAAVATDTSGATATSSPVSITVLSSSSVGWITQTSGTSENLNGVSFVDAMDGWAVGDSGTVLHTSDGGVTWTTQASGTTAALHAVQFLNSQGGWAVGDLGVILATSDGGSSWTAQSSGTGMSLGSIHFIDSLNGWAAGGGVILKTTTGGSSWSLESTASTTGSGIFFVDTVHGWTTSATGATVLGTQDGGASWADQSGSAGSDATQGLFFFNGTAGWAVGLNETILHTSDGVTWSPEPRPSGTFGGAFTAVTFVTPTNGWFVGENGQIGATANGGSTWSLERGASAAPTLHGVEFVDQMTGWAVGDGGTILKTTNGGRKS